jgi:surface polysaccharide O-acyltransferase-like enzyme
MSIPRRETMFLNHIHNYRAIAILGVVATHTLQSFSWPSGSLVFNGLSFILNETSIWFVFIAGFLFQHLSNRFKLPKYLLSKAKFVVLPYLILSIPALLYFTLLNRQDNVWPGFYDHSPLVQAGLFLLTGKHLAPYWFIPMICLFYLLAPLFLRIDKSRFAYLWLLPPLLLLSALIGRDGLLELTPLDGRFATFSKALYMLPVYMLGMLCSKYHDRLLELLKCYNWILATACLAMIALGALGAQFGKDAHFLHFLFKITTGVYLIYLLHLADRPLGNRLTYLAHASFGVYFLHGYFLAAEKILSAKLQLPAFIHDGNIVSFAILTLAVTLLCVMTVKAAQMLFKDKSRLLVGS